MCDSSTVDTPDVLSRLESLGPSVAVEAPLLPDGPGTALEALSRWLTAVGVRPGMTLGPRPLALVPVFTAYARARGWDVEVECRMVGRALSLAGCQRSHDGYRMARDAAAALWRAAGGKPKTKRSRPLRPPRRIPKPRVTRHPSKPLRTCDGRVWRSQRELMAELGVTALAISRGVHNGTSVRGYHVRFATPAEVAAWRAQQAGEEWDGGIGSPS